MRLCHGRDAGMRRECDTSFAASGIGDLRDMATFADKLHMLARDGVQRFEGFACDIAARHGPAPKTQHMWVWLLH